MSELDKELMGGNIDVQQIALVGMDTTDSFVIDGNSYFSNEVNSGVSE